MKNSEFFYQQYDKLSWENQEKTKINSFIFETVIKETIQKCDKKDIAIFDIGFGIGYFLKMLNEKLSNRFGSLKLEGCEPSKRNYSYFLKNSGLKNISTYNAPFQSCETKSKFDFITSTYTFTAFIYEDLVEVVKKIHSMLKEKGKFIMVVAEEKYLEKKLTQKKDLFIERGIINYQGNKYYEVLHYSEIPQIGTVIDYNREPRFYIKLFEDNGFNLVSKKNMDDNGFICTIFVFEKN